MKRLRIGVTGFGNVGQGFLQLLAEKEELLRKKYHIACSLVFIAGRSKGSFFCPEGLAPSEVWNTFASSRTLDALPGERISDPLELLNKRTVDVLGESTPTNLETGEPGLSFIRTALKAGISVTTTNKGPVALAWEELAALAEASGAELLCEGTVLSGTPAINLIRHALGGCEAEEIAGIFNGTTNFMLSRMEEGLEYQEALREAQELGYAEADPTADVDGWDAAVKAVILGNLVFGISSRVEQVDRKGIRHISGEDVRKALEENRRIRLIARVRSSSGKLQATVAPQILEASHPLAQVRGATNALMVRTDVLGEIFISGPGAGRRETGQALLVDILELAGKM